LVTKGIFKIHVGEKSIYEIEEYIRNMMDELGTLDESEGRFIYDEGNEDVIPIVVIDDITGILGENAGSNIRNDNAHKLASKLKAIAKIYDIVLVLGVPSVKVFKRDSPYKNSAEEVDPYNLYSDISIILHNPLETNDKVSVGYETGDFMNLSTGACYLRTGFIAYNHRGPSGVYFGYFMYPENGYFIELPPAEATEEVEVISRLANLSSIDIIKERKREKDLNNNLGGTIKPKTQKEEENE